MTTKRRSKTFWRNMRYFQTYNKVGKRGKTNIPSPKSVLRAMHARRMPGAKRDSRIGLPKIRMTCSKVSDPTDVNFGERCPNMENLVKQALNLELIDHLQIN